MRVSARLSTDQQRLCLHGAVDFSNAQALYLQGLQWLRKQDAALLCFDMSDLQSGRTVVAAMLLQWLRQLPAPQQAKIVAAPLTLQAIFRASNLSHLLAVDDDV